MLKNDWTEAWETPGNPEPLGMPLQYMVSGIAVSATHRWPDQTVDVAFNPVGQVVGQFERVEKSAAVIQRWVEEYLDADGQPRRPRERIATPAASRPDQRASISITRPMPTTRVSAMLRVFQATTAATAPARAWEWIRSKWPSGRRMAGTVMEARAAGGIWRSRRWTFGGTSANRSANARNDARIANVPSPAPRIATQVLLTG